MIVAARAGAPGEYREWMNIGEFASSMACVKAADELKVPVFRCIAKGH